MRLDYAINRDGFSCAVGVNNGNTTTLPYLLCQSYHTISVGLTNGSHSAGFTTLDVAGRIKPDIVAPGTATSFATPMVAGAAGLLHEKLAAAPFSLTGADLARVTKSLILAGATRTEFTDWENTSARPLDDRHGAGELNIHHSYATLMAGRQTPSTTSLLPLRGWAAQTVSGNSTSSYFFTVPAGASVPFSAALTWHRAISGHAGILWGTPSAALANLNLHLHEANGFTQGPLVFSSSSSVDNVELIARPSLAPGNYVLTVENTSATATPYALAWQGLPFVSLSTPVAEAREVDGQAATVVVTRTGDTQLPLFVPLSISGTAIPGSHYQALPASVTIPSGASSVTFQVTPVPDLLAQGDRTVAINVAADFALVRDAAKTASIVIRDKPFDAWRFANFSTVELQNPSISGATADPDEDGLSNLLEYALNLPPRISGGQTVNATEAGGVLTLAAAKNPDATDIQWFADISSDLILWDDAEILENSAANFLAGDPEPPTDGSPRFMRLRIVRP